jgi:hypothetical protein
MWEELRRIKLLSMQRKYKLEYLQKIKKINQIYTKILRIRNEENQILMGTYDIQCGSFGGSPFYQHKTPKIQF